jgi:hypothetical protein
MHAKNGKIHANGKIIQPKKLFMCHVLPEDTDLQCPPFVPPKILGFTVSVQLVIEKQNLNLGLNWHRSNESIFLPIYYFVPF